MPESIAVARKLLNLTEYPRFSHHNEWSYYCIELQEKLTKYLEKKR